jgi:glycyl-tRNA synthetase beta chain
MTDVPVNRFPSGLLASSRVIPGVTLLHGAEVVPGRVLDLDSGRTTRGHRFMSRGEIDIATADAYEPTLLAEGKVIPNFAERRANIERQLLAAAAKQGALLNEYADLLDEVAALVEHPTVYVGEFEAEFLAVPQECLILTMRANQKYFPLFDGAGKLLNRFLIVSNMQVADPINIVAGNARVVRPRLSDARFFFEQDKKQKLEARLPRLAPVVYHNKLGSQLERVERLEALAGAIAAQLHGDVAAAKRAARLAKADLVTDMVGEFPELQGIMGRYYALADGEGEVVADAIQAHYQPALRRRRAARRQRRRRGGAGRQARRPGRLLRHRHGADRRQGPLRAAPRRARRAAHPDGGAAAARAAQADRHRGRRLQARPADRRRASPRSCRTSCSSA